MSGYNNHTEIPDTFSKIFKMSYEMFDRLYGNSPHYPTHRQYAIDFYTKGFQDGASSMREGKEEMRIIKEIYKHLDSLPYAGGYPTGWEKTLAKHLLTVFESPTPLREAAQGNDSIEFAEWIETCDYSKFSGLWSKWISGKGWSDGITIQELYTIFKNSQSKEIKPSEGGDGSKK